MLDFQTFRSKGVVFKPAGSIFCFTDAVSAMAGVIFKLATEAHFTLAAGAGVGAGELPPPWRIRLHRIPALGYWWL